jgi:hypothetical protein
MAKLIKTILFSPRQVLAIRFLRLLPAVDAELEHQRTE